MSRDVGPGEEKIAWELGGETLGGLAACDVVDRAGNLWEVKEPDASGQIRPGVEGRKAFQPWRRELEEVARQLQHGFERIDVDALAAFVEPWAPARLRDVLTFIERDVPMIIAGEMSTGRILGNPAREQIGLLQVLEFVHHLMSDAFTAPAREVVWGDAVMKVPTHVYVHAARMMGLDDVDIDASVPELIAGTFMHEAFRRPRQFTTTIWRRNAVKASQVFKNVSGVVVVRSDSFMIIPIDRVDVVLRFARVSKGEPRFDLIGEDV